MRYVRSLAGAVSVMLAVAGCGSDSGVSTSARDKSKETTTTTTDTGTADDYVGLTKEAAIAKAEANRRPWRIAREDGESFLLTQDYVPNRVDFEIDNGKVTSAKFG